MAKCERIGNMADRQHRRETCVEAARRDAMNGRNGDGGTSKPASEEDAPGFDIESDDDGDAAREGTGANPSILLPPD
jgi:hypothetical protein